MAEETTPKTEETNEVEAHSVLELQQTEDAEVEAHHCISVLSVAQHQH